MSIKSKKLDPFFVAIGKELGVDPAEIRLKNAEDPREITCIGPKPTLKYKLPDEWPWPIDDEYCFTFVLDLSLPRTVCAAWRVEYETLQQSLQLLIQQEAWEEVAEVAHRLTELAQGLENCRRTRSRTIRFCIFPPQRV